MGLLVSYMTHASSYKRVFLAFGDSDVEKLFHYFRENMPPALEARRSSGLAIVRKPLVSIRFARLSPVHIRPCYGRLDCKQGMRGLALEAG